MSYTTSNGAVYEFNGGTYSITVDGVDKGA